MNLLTGRLARTAQIGMAVAAMALGTVVPVATGAHAATTATPPAYLALGDSVAFGYVPPNAVVPPNYNDPQSFVGYPEDLAHSLGMTVANASCPGETTISFLAEGGQSNGCENSLGSPIGYRTEFPLHVKYAGPQMAYAIHYLTTNPTTKLVTIDIGANDAFICQETTSDDCTSPSEIAGLLAQIRDNLTSIYTQIRDVAGYHGTLVALTYYSTDYADVLLTAETKILDTVIGQVTHHFGGVVADGFAAFKGPSAKFGGSPCAAGLLIPVTGGGCNIHPTAAGHLLLAAAIARAIGD
jgi:lysophospholipase L1-like esterase